MRSGRVIQAVENIGKLYNTIIIYISGDNGSSTEGRLVGTPNEVVRFFPCNFSSRAIPIPKATPLIIWLRVWEAAIFRIPLGDR
jgi:arylsulfatase